MNDLQKNNKSSNSERLKETLYLIDSEYILLLFVKMYNRLSPESRSVNSYEFCNEKVKKSIQMWNIKNTLEHKFAYFFNILVVDFTKNLIKNCSCFFIYFRRDNRRAEDSRLELFRMRARRGRSRETAPQAKACRGATSATMSLFFPYKTMLIWVSERNLTWKRKTRIKNALDQISMLMSGYQNHLTPFAGLVPSLLNPSSPFQQIPPTQQQMEKLAGKKLDILFLDFTFFLPFLLFFHLFFQMR